MAEEGLRAAAPRAARYSSYAGEEGRAAAPNLLLVDAGRDLHDFSAAAPGEVLVTDITEFRLPTTRGRCTSRRPSTCSTATSPPSRWAPRRPRRSWPRCSPAPWPPPGGGFTLHSDRGWHYRTPDWVRACGEAGWRGRCRARGTRRTTPPARGSSAGSRSSSFHGRDWRGVSAERFAAELAEWIRWYREGRLKAFDEGGRKVYDTIAGRRRRLGLAA